MLYYRVQDLRSLLDPPYQSLLSLREFINRAIKNEPFHSPLTTIPIPQDPCKLHIRLYRAMKQQQSNKTPTISSSDVKIINTLPNIPTYFYENATSPDVPEHNDSDNNDVIYNQNDISVLKSRIICAFLSFSTPRQRPSFTLY